MPQTEIRLLDEHENFVDWLSEEDAMSRVNAGTHDEVYYVGRTRRMGWRREFYGIKPVALPSNAGNSTAAITVDEMEINAGLYPGHDSERGVSRARYRQVRQKVAAWAPC